MTPKESSQVTTAEIREVASTADLQQVLELESLAFGGQGEDIFSLAMIAKTGWILTISQPGSTTLHGAIELVPTKETGVGFIHGVVVKPDAQSGGAGVALIAQAERVAKESGLTRIEATISPTNGASLNAFINKRGYKATHFYYDFYGKGEHRFLVEKNIINDKPTFDEAHWREFYATQAYPREHLLVRDNDYGNLSKLINGQNYHVVGLIRPEKSGHNQNLLYLVQQPPQEVTLPHE